MSNLMLFRTVARQAIFRQESSVSISYIIFQIRSNEMFTDLLSESCKEGEEFLYWVKKMRKYFEDKFVQISLNFWLSFTSCFT